MFEQNQNQNHTNVQKGQNKANTALLILILGFLSLASIGIMSLAVLKQMYPRVFAAPGINKELNYQGKLQDASGITVPDGTYAMQFTIYDAAAAGNILWSAQEDDDSDLNPNEPGECGAPFNPFAKSIGVSRGVFSTLLGDTGDCPITLDFNDDAYYLGVTVAADPEMTPRKRIGAAGYAFNADLIDGVNSSNTGGAGCTPPDCDYVPVTDSSGNFTLSADVTFDGTTFFLDSTNNNIGIGTAAPDINRTLDLTTSKRYGVYSVTSSTAGSAAGVYGESTSAGGLFIENYGGYFTAAGEYDVAVKGLASGSTGANYAGYFWANGSSGYGVYGRANSGTGTTYGVYGITGSPTGWGGYFTGGNGLYASKAQINALSPSSAVYTDGSNFLTSTPPTSGSIGYWSRAGTTLSPTTTDDIVSVISNVTGAAITGTASNPGAVTNYGGYFTAAGDTGVAVVGLASSSNPGANNAGGYFVSSGDTTAAGVVGYNNSATGTTYGVKGMVDSLTGWAGYFTGGYGIYTNNDLYVGATSETIADAGFTMAGAGSGFFADMLGVEGNIYTDGALSVVGDISTDGSLTAAGNIESLASTAFNPVLKSTTATGSGAINLYVSGRYVYVVNAGAATLQIFDVTDPASPTSVSSVATNANPRYIYVSGRYAYIVHDSVTSTLEIFDVSNPTSPASLSSTATGIDPKSIYVSGHYAYIAETAGQLEIFDVSNPAAPISVSSTWTGTDPFNLYVSGRYAYVVSQAAGTLQIFDVSNPAAPSAIGSVATGGDLRGVYVSGRYAYVANMGAGTLQVFDIKDPSTPTSVGSVAAGSPYSVYVSGRYAYVADAGGSTLKVVDVSTPSSPTVVGSTTTGSSPTSVFVSGRYAYTANAGADTFQVFDVHGLETTSAMVHSLEAGNLQVRNDIIAQGEIQTKGGITSLGSGLFNQGLSALTADAAGKAVLGWATGTTLANIGGAFRADGPGGSGVYGYAADTSATVNYGGYFTAGGSSGSYGVYGQTQAEWGYGVFGASVPLGPATAGIGVGGYTTGTATGSSGVNGQANGAGTVYGVYGLAGNTGGAVSNYGGYFEGGGQGGARGVYGFASGIGGTNYGVYGQVTSAVGWAGYFIGGNGLYADRLSVADPTSGIAYNTIGVAATSHALASTSDLFIAGALEVDGWAWLDGGHPDIAEMIAYSGQGEAGDVIVIDENQNNTAKLAAKPYDQNVIGIISTKPSLVITGGIKDGKLLAVAGRVPTKVTNINGSIGRGDLLTTSSKPGYAMKATEVGPIVGKALENFDGESGTIWVFLNVGWYGGVKTEMATTSSTSTMASGYNIALDKLTADLDAGGFAITNVSKILSKDEKWEIDENGILKARVALPEENVYDPMRDPASPKYKEIYALSSTGIEVVLSGSSKLDRGEALVDFNQVDKDFMEIIDQTVPFKISVTPTESCRGLYVVEKYSQGFEVKELNGGISGATFDWIVIGRRKGY